MNPKVHIAVNIAKLWTSEISYWIINGICNQHYDNQRSRQDENTLKESEKHQSKVLFIDLKKKGKYDNNNGVKIQAVNILKYYSSSHISKMLTWLGLIISLITIGLFFNKL